MQLPKNMSMFTLLETVITETAKFEDHKKVRSWRQMLLLILSVRVFRNWLVSKKRFVKVLLLLNKISIKRKKRWSKKRLEAKKVIMKIQLSSSFLESSQVCAYCRFSCELVLSHFTNWCYWSLL